MSQNRHEQAFLSVDVGSFSGHPRTETHWSVNSRARARESCPHSLYGALKNLRSQAKNGSKLNLRWKKTKNWANNLLHSVSSAHRPPVLGSYMCSLRKSTTYVSSFLVGYDTYSRAE